MGVYQIKKLLHAKETTIKMKRKPNVWENIFVNNTSDKVYISKIYKELILLNTKRTNNPIKNWQRT